jgi:hypothetical protein
MADVELNIDNLIQRLLEGTSTCRLRSAALLLYGQEGPREGPREGQGRGECVRDRASQKFKAPRAKGAGRKGLKGGEEPSPRPRIYRRPDGYLRSLAPFTLSLALQLRPPPAAIALFYA